MSDTNAGIYTVHPFDDEWTWDSRSSGSHPWVTSSLQEAIDHANLVRLEYASMDDVDQDWLAGFWSAIYQEIGDTEEGVMIGWVSPQGEYTEASELPPLDEDGGWKR